MEPEVSLLCSPDPISGSYPEPDKSSVQPGTSVNSGTIESSMKFIYFVTDAFSMPRGNQIVDFTKNRNIIY
jgi:hypothetical protein